MLLTAACSERRTGGRVSERRPHPADCSAGTGGRRRAPIARTRSGRQRLVVHATPLIVGAERTAAPWAASQGSSRRSCAAGGGQSPRCRPCSSCRCGGRSRRHRRSGRTRPWPIGRWRRLIFAEARILAHRRRRARARSPRRRRSGTATRSRGPAGRGRTRRRAIRRPRRGAVLAVGGRQVQRHAIGAVDVDHVDLVDRVTSGVVRHRKAAAVRRPGG